MNGPRIASSRGPPGPGIPPCHAGAVVRLSEGRSRGGTLAMATQGSCARPAEEGSSAPARGEGEGEGGSREDPEGASGKRMRKKKRKKKYNRHPKPPYTYLAMIALVIQASPGRKLKLSQIIQEISTLFPFFQEGYQGWKDSIRHNLSSNDCFYKVLKDPAKPKAKGNFWTVDVERIPPDALKLQNTPVSRQGEKTFAFDLAPYVLHGWPFGGPQPPPGSAASEGRSPGLAGEGPHQQSSFSIDSLLSDFQDVGLCGKPRLGAEPPYAPAAGRDVWGPVPIFRLSSGPPVLPWRPSCQLPTLRSFSSSSSLSSLGSLSPTEREAGRPRPKKGQGPPTLAKRPRVLQAPEGSGSDSGSSGGCTSPPASQLPTSYTKCVAPNMVAPHSHSPHFLAFPDLPFYSPTPYASPLCLEVMPGPPGGALPSSRLSIDLDQGMPPNKTIFDVWMTHPADIVHPGFSQPSPFPRSAVLTHCDFS